MQGFDGSPVHNCSTSPESIRLEVETFKMDFNNRMKQVLFSSSFTAYYGGFLPCCFAQVWITNLILSLPHSGSRIHLIFSLYSLFCTMMYIGQLSIWCLYGLAVFSCILYIATLSGNKTTGN